MIEQLQNATEINYKKGDFVFATCINCEPWPAKITKILPQNLYQVKFFNSKSIAVLEKKDLTVFDMNTKKLYQQKYSKSKKYTEKRLIVAINQCYRSYSKKKDRNKEEAETYTISDLLNASKQEFNDHDINQDQEEVEFKPVFNRFKSHRFNRLQTIEEVDSKLEQSSSSIKPEDFQIMNQLSFHHTFDLHIMKPIQEVEDQNKQQPQEVIQDVSQEVTESAVEDFQNVNAQEWLPILGIVHDRDAIIEQVEAEQQLLLLGDAQTMATLSSRNISTDFDEGEGERHILDADFEPFNQSTDSTRVSFMRGSAQYLNQQREREALQNVSQEEQSLLSSVQIEEIPENEYLQLVQSIRERKNKNSPRDLNKTIRRVQKYLGLLSKYLQEDENNIIQHRSLSMKRKQCLFYFLQDSILPALAVAESRILEKMIQFVIAFESCHRRRKQNCLVEYVLMKQKLNYFRQKFSSANVYLELEQDRCHQILRLFGRYSHQGY